MDKPRHIKSPETNNNDSGLEDFQELEIRAVAKPPVSTAVLFSNLHLNNTLLNNIRDAQFENPSPVQALAIPKAIMGRDILCQAKSGTGKTAVFVLSILQLFCDVINNPDNLDDSLHSSKYLILVHTKELVGQINEEFLRFSKGLSISIKSSFSHELNQFNILIGTPESICQLLREKAIDMADLNGIVVDECDVMMGDNMMKRDFQTILRRNIAAKGLQIMMFTATLTKHTKAECLKYLKDPFLVIVDDESKLTLHGLKQFYIETKEREKMGTLMSLIEYDDTTNHDINNKMSLKRLNYQQMIIFCKASQNALYIEHMIKGARAIFPTMDIKDRIRILNEFKNREFHILSTTDILSRGIDIQNVDCVLNYDLPIDPQTYLHRVGRAGRFETTGVALSFVNGMKDGIRLNEIMDLYEIDIEDYKL